MANPTAMTSGVALFEATNSAQTCTLEAQYQYRLIHTGLEDDGATADTTAIFLGFNGTIAAASQKDENRAILVNGQTLYIGPGVTSMSYLAAADEAPCFVLNSGPGHLGHY